MCVHCNDPNCKSEQVFQDVFGKAITALATAAQMVEHDLAHGEFNYDTMRTYGEGQAPIVVTVMNYGIEAMREVLQPSPSLGEEFEMLGKMLGLDLDNPEILRALQEAKESGNRDAFGDVVKKYSTKPGFAKPGLTLVPEP